MVQEFGICDFDVKVVDGNDTILIYEKYGFKTIAHILRLSRLISDLWRCFK